MILRMQTIQQSLSFALSRAEGAAPAPVVMRKLEIGDLLWPGSASSAEMLLVNGTLCCQLCTSMRSGCSHATTVLPRVHQCDSRQRLGHPGPLLCAILRWPRFESSSSRHTAKLAVAVQTCSIPAVKSNGFLLYLSHLDN